MGISGTTGNDNIDGTSGDDVIAGNSGNDRVNGRGGDDVLLGGGGDDRLAGGAGNDVLFGGRGNDTVAGGLGDDVISGGFGADTLSGGRGSDTFVFFARSADAVDTIRGFEDDETIALFQFEQGSGRVDENGNVYATANGEEIQIATIANYDASEDVVFEYYDGSFADSDLG